MVRLIALFGIILLATSCDIYLTEPRFDVRDELVGRYDIEEFSATYNVYTQYVVRIEKSGYSGNEIYIKNIYDAGIRVHVLINFDRIDIPRQVIDGYEIDGVGTIFANEISMNYRVRDLYSNRNTDFCETTAWRY